MADETGFFRVIMASQAFRLLRALLASFRLLIVGEESASGAPSLRPLSPEYVPEQHQDYVSLVVAALARRDGQAPRNIAVTGHYGSGKSSALSEVESRLARRRTRGLFRPKTRAINLSLPSLGVGGGRLPEKGDPARERTNLIQKEILKQLLYRQSPSKMPGSRYGRLDRFRPRVPVTLLVAFIGVGIGLVFNVPSKVTKALPSSVHSDPSWVFWLSLAGMMLAFAGVSLLFQRLFYKDIRISELGAGTTKLGLSKQSGTYFDEYLDEIVYFFQRSKTSVVIFEDLDRFKDPHIFETLRELNVLLNNAGQIRRRPIKFVYAIRDSIFEQLDVEVGADDNGTGVAGTEPKSGAARAASTDPDSLRLTSTNRTKFFDLIVPMVPFISHRTSRELIEEQLKVLPEEKRPTRAVLDIVGAYLTDMRLIKNICNEYEVFSRRILTGDGLKELQPDGLFAMVVYKNLWMADYEAVRHGDSKLDEIYRAYRNWVAEQTAAGRAQVTEATEQLRHLSGTVPRSEWYGRRLQEVLAVALGTDPQPSATVTVEALGRPFQWSDVTTTTFWRVWFAQESTLFVDPYPRYSSGRRLTLAQVETLIGKPLSLADWTDQDRSALEAEAKAGRDAQDFAIRASMKAALAAADKHFKPEDDDQSLRNYAKTKLEGADLAVALLEAGYIDENFTLYVTQFPGGASASAMNFIIKAAQRDEADINYQFTGGSDDIETVLSREEARVLDGESVYNVEIFDHLLTSSPSILEGPVSRLTGTAKCAEEFIATYLERGRETAQFVHQLSAVWPDIFAYLRQHPHETDDKNYSRLSNALLGANPDVTYHVSDEDRELMQTAYAHLPAITGSQPPEQADKIAKVLHGLGVRLAQLSEVAEPLRAYIVERGLYPLTIANLKAGLGPDASLSLDGLKDTRPNDVYPFVLAHLDAYLPGAVQAGIPSIADPAQFLHVIEDVLEEDESRVRSVAAAAAPECLVEDLNGLQVSVWPELATVRRFKITDNNVILYVDQYGVDEALAGWLDVVGKIELAGEIPDEIQRVELAVHLLNATALAVETKKTVVESLDLSKASINPMAISTSGWELVPWLVSEGFSADAPEAFEAIVEAEWPVKENLINASHEFPQYLPELVLTSDDLYSIASKNTQVLAKQALLDNIGSIQNQLGSDGAVALARWAGEQGLTLTSEMLQILAANGGHADSKAMIRLLGLSATTLDLESIKAVLHMLGDPYKLLTDPGKRPKIPISDGAEGVLERLKQEQIVSSFRREKRKGNFVVINKNS